MACIVESVRESCARVSAEASHVSIDNAVLESFSKSMEMDTSSVKWDSDGWHYQKDVAEGGPLTAQYIFVMDALNFCFWPSTTGMEYDHLATSLKNVLEADEDAFSASKLAAMTPETLVSWLSPHDVPLVEERVSKLRELGRALAAHYGGLAANMVKAANHSAVALVDLIAAALPGFCDHTVYKGRQVFFYKRAQICVSDLWAAYGKQTVSRHAFTGGAGGAGGDDSAPFGSFYDMDQLTMFADYRVPQLLREVGVMKYSDALAAAVDGKTTLTAGSEEEVEIRAATVEAVERMRATMKGNGVHVFSVEVDWILWQVGERRKDEIPPHHRTLTCFY